MKEMVIFKQLGQYKMTSLENYKAHISNAREITIFEGCSSFAQCISCLPKVDDVIFYDRTGDV